MDERVKNRHQRHWMDLFVNNSIPPEITIPGARRERNLHGGDEAKRSRERTQAEDTEDRVLKSRWKAELCKVTGDWSRSRVRTDGLECGNDILKMCEEGRPKVLNAALQWSELIEATDTIIFPIMLKIHESGSKKVQI